MSSLCSILIITMTLGNHYTDTVMRAPLFRRIRAAQAKCSLKDPNHRINYSSPQCSKFGCQSQPKNLGPDRWIILSSV
ncbi:hypothetical protein BKA67DRAFT_575514 [Truncatella angustata]|uniref:Uncharacterized protein n=1 Tax=Truncatella angustata TaxID=152316 RepID=A0A9P8UEX7_9PEZI|nr:uncharacterized protein BKA67DRAFT_575514 [Truncatella angustata]KAH6648674.1 hypothetical protein BKA67DRAFT_575514 [Truncatella angustata]